MKKYLNLIMYPIMIILIGVLISSILYYFNITTDKLNCIFLLITMVLAIFIGSIKFSKTVNYKGIINGLIYFIIWFIIMMILSLIFIRNNFTYKNIIYYIILLVFSIIGGILGKNLKEENSD